jgi:hypothetical protein
MIRKTIIVLVTAAALSGGLAADALAHGGGGGGGARMSGGFEGIYMGGSTRHATRLHHPPAKASVVATPRWRGPDPSYGPGTAAYHWYQSMGRCVIDEGYGRYSFCDEF